MKAARNPNYLKVVGKTFRVVEAMAHAQSRVRLSDLSRQLKQPKATVFRILYTLGELGYVRQDSRTEAYGLTDRIGWFSRNEMKETLKGAARPYMERLLSRFEQTVNLGLLDQGQVLYLEILEGLRSIRMAATVNTYAPLHASALGKSIAAFLEPAEVTRLLRQQPLTAYTEKTMTNGPRLLKHLRRVRKQGYAVDNEEVETGARCVAAPLFNAQGRAFAALSVSGPTSHIWGERVGEIAAALKLVCRKISAQIGFLHPGVERASTAQGVK